MLKIVRIVQCKETLRTHKIGKKNSLLPKMAGTRRRAKWSVLRTSALALSLTAAKHRDPI